MTKPRNDRSQAVTKFCLAMEEHRRSEAGRVRTAREFVAHFFPHDDGKAKDQLFVHMPKEVRGPVLSAWGIRGAKAASRDEDDKVREVVHDALVAGDIDDATFEEGVTSQVLVDWIALPDWWSFWRQGKLSGVAIQKALATARELHLIDDKWFLLNVQGRGGKLKGTDVVCDTLSKDQIVAWVRKIHESGDGSAAGIVGAISWETVLAKTAQDALLFALDAFAKKVGLFVEPPPVEEKKPEAKLETKPETKSVRPAPPAAATAPAAATTNPAVATTPAASAVTAAHPKVPAEALTAKHDKVAEAYPTMNAPHDILAAAEAEVVKARVALAERERRDSGMTAPIPVAAATAHIVDDVPVEIEEDTPSIPTLGGAGQSEEESPKLKEARAAMMATLMQSGPGDVAANPRQAWGESDVPAKPSSLEWPAPPPGMVSVISPGTKTPVPAGPPSDEFLTFESLDDEMERPQARSAPPPLPKR